MNLSEIVTLLRCGEIKKAAISIYTYHRGILFMSGFILMFLLMLVFSSGNSRPLLEEERVPVEEENTNIVAVKETMDPRDYWTHTVVEKLEKTAASLEQKLGEQDSKAEEAMQVLKDELIEVKQDFAKYKANAEQQELGGNIRAISPEQTEEQKQPALVKSLGMFSRKYKSSKKNIKNYIPTGTHVRAVLLTGVVVGTGSDMQSNPEPVEIRLTDEGIFGKGNRNEQIKEATLIGGCSGDLSSERAKCRLHTLSLINDKGEIIEKPVEGWMVGEDGRNGIQGKIVDKSSDILRMAMLNGVLGGMSNFFESQATAGVSPVLALTGQQNTKLSNIATLKAGAASGTSDAFSKMADFLMERFNSMSPQISVASGREIDVVFKHGVSLYADEQDEKPRPEQSMAGNMGQNTANSSNFNSNYGTNQQSSSGYEQFGRNSFNEAISNMNNDMSARGF